VGEVDYQVLFNMLVGLVGFLGGWVLNNLSKAIERLDADVREMPKQYVSKEDWKSAMSDMKEEMRAGLTKIDNTLNTIFSRLDKKEDKS
jgi:hypothetical protein